MFRRAFALPFALVFMVILSVLFGALYLRVTQSLRFARYDRAALQAGELARAACDLGYAQYQRHGPDWLSKYHLPNPVPGSALAPGFGADATFELRIFDRSELHPDPFPAGGTYKVLVGTARVGDRTATRRMTVKLTSPFLNYLSAGPNFNLYQDVQGPVFLSSAAPTYAGDCRLIHQVQSPFTSLENHFYPSSIRFGGSIQAMGDIYVRNDSRVGGGYALAPLLLNGDYPAGTVLFHPDLTAVNNPTPQTGQVTLSSDSEFRPHIRYAAQIPKMQSMLDIYRTHQADAEVVNLEIRSADYPQGVLVEFVGPEVVISPARLAEVGRMYDRSVYLDSRFAVPQGSGEGPVPAGSDASAWAANGWDVRGDYVATYQDSAYPGNADALSRSEMAWDDPFLPNQAAPAVLCGAFTDLNSNQGFSLAPGPADYVPVRRVVREKLHRVRHALRRDTWTVLRLVAQDAGLDSADVPARKVPPPVFVRGMVQGKVVLVYDVADDALDPIHEDNLADFHTSAFLLAQPEDPLRDTPADLLGPVPGVPGGLHLADDRIQAGPVATGSESADMAIVMCRGSFGMAGVPLRGTSWLVDSGGARVNYRQRQLDLDLVYERAYGARFRACPSGDQQTAIYPCNCVQIASINDYHRWLTDGRIVTRPFADPDGRNSLLSHLRMGSWRALGVSPPAGANPDEEPNLPRFMREFFSCAQPSQKLVGGLGSLSGSGASAVEAKFDYRWRKVEAREIGEDIKLPVGPVVIQAP